MGWTIMMATIKTNVILQQTQILQRTPRRLLSIDFWQIFRSEIIGIDEVQRDGIYYYKKVKYVGLYSTSSRSASDALPLLVSRRWSWQANPTARHQRALRNHVIRVGVSRGMPVYSPSLCRVLIHHGHWAGSGWVGQGAWFSTEMVYPSKDGHPSRN